MSATVDEVPDDGVPKCDHGAPLDESCEACLDEIEVLEDHE